MDRETQDALGAIQTQILEMGIPAFDPSGNLLGVVLGIQAGDTSITLTRSGRYIQIKAPAAGTAHALLDGVVDNDTIGGSPVKGAIIAGNGTPRWDRQMVGPDGLFLKADSTQLNGLAWATPAGGGGATLMAQVWALAGKS